jgi:SAM-dependent methyltransferase
MKIFGAYSRYYDLLYKSKDYAKEIAYVSRIIDRHASNARRLLDLGCGTGIHACAFAKAGYHVTAIDRSADMLEQARERARRELDSDGPGSIAFIRGDIRNFRLSSLFDVVVALFHVISYLPKNDDLDAAFARIREHLDPRGILVFDHWYGPAVLTDRPVQRVKIFEDNDVKIVRIATPTLYVNDNLVDVAYNLIVIEKASGRCEQLAENHRMRYLFQPELELFLSRHQLKPIAFTEWLSDKVPDEASWNTVVTAAAKS